MPWSVLPYSAMFSPYCEGKLSGLAPVFFDGVTQNLGCPSNYSDTFPAAVTCRRGWASTPGPVYRRVDIALGEAEVERGVKVRLYNFHDQTVGNPAVPAKLAAALKTET